jgi:hypothetical protein
MSVDLFKTFLLLDHRYWMPTLPNRRALRIPEYKAISFLYACIVYSSCRLGALSLTRLKTLSFHPGDRSIMPAR